MTEYFHSDISRYKKRMKRIFIIILLPLLTGSVVIVLLLLINLRFFIHTGFPESAFYFILSSAFIVTMTCWITTVKTNRAITRNSRYTFFDIGEREVVFSRYAGEYISMGQRIIIRRLYVIPLSALDSVEINPKNRKLLFKSQSGGIRSYTDKSEKLGYHFLNGKLNFDDWWLNNYCFKSLSELIIPDIFNNAHEMGLSVEEAKHRFLLIPPKKAYIHKEMDFVKQKKAYELYKKMNRDY